MFRLSSLFLAAALVAAAPVHAKDADALRLGIDPGYPPMDVKTPDGHVAGSTSISAMKSADALRCAASGSSSNSRG
jgi:hypothetical protein